MIKYNLHCDQGHDFEGWFSSSKDFDEQSDRGLLACPQCNSASIGKALMTPSVGPSTKGKDMVPVASPHPAHEEMVAKIRQLKREIEKTADNVGSKFPEEARKIHYGEAEPRGIYGKASMEEAASLAEEGVDFLPLPELPEEKN